MKWEDGIKYEVEFWEKWYKTYGLDWPSDYRFRIDVNTEVQDHIAKHIHEEGIRILDVGSGPLTVLGKKHNGKLLDITACDALADYYDELNFRYRIIPIISVEKCRAEALLDKYGTDSFGLVHAQNCIDHCELPIDAIRHMIGVVKPGGKVIMRHEVNEGENEGYGGFHQWNFYGKDGKFMISGKGNEYNVTDLFSAVSQIEILIIDGYITTVITKNAL
jgi:SAM-dependent methyltransferase